jgi:hypothetical protein
MSKRYKLLLILIGTLKRIHANYRIVGSDEPQDRDSVVVLNEHPRSVFLKVTNEGIEVHPSFLSLYEEELQADIIVSVVMVAADVQITE